MVYSSISLTACSRKYDQNFFKLIFDIEKLYD